MKLLILFMMAVFFGSPAIISCVDESTSSPRFVFKPAPRKGVVAKIGNEEITRDSMIRGVEVNVYRAEKELYDLTFNQLKALITKKIIEKRAKEKGMNTDEYLAKKVIGKIEVSKSQVDEFIKEKKIPKKHINDSLLEKIRLVLAREMKEKATDRWLAKHLEKEGVEIYLKEPERPFFEVRTANSPWTGDSGAKVTIVEFSDFQCPHCRRGAEILKEIRKKYKKKVKIVFKHFPLSFHHNARGAAHASMCAHDQSKESFWKMHDLMFQQQSALDKKSLKALAEKIGLDGKRFEECIQQNKFEAHIDQDIKHAKEVGIRSTPTFFVNGRIISGAQPLEVFEKEIKRHL